MGGTGWLEWLLVELGYEMWIGDAARTRAAAAHKQKTDVRDAELILKLFAEGASSSVASVVDVACGAEGSASVAGAWASVGTDANTGEEPAAGHSQNEKPAAPGSSVEPGGVSQAEGTKAG